ncbi:hypothetical protein BDM02DRAFT_3186652 [Thelephora ganbajun]|uniref:Uncharacterized protein n=1 Tax=Thelephora ganbajun TaxID=370292 RepID=A0ACB6ZHF6_THEGA|nr:hypothetical protein BDM02DRAFT_3186652 [Thelephora ganbajun]
MSILYREQFVREKYPLCKLVPLQTVLDPTPGQNIQDRLRSTCDLRQLNRIGNNHGQEIITQIDVLNTDYAPSLVKFTLANNITEIAKTAWFNTLPPDPGTGLLGYTTLPDGYADGSKLDGVIILSSFVPGGTPAPYNVRSLTHEASHWLGLYHTFQNGRIGGGNSIADTPPDASPTYGCPIGRGMTPT